jgi:hypothetical protein
MKKKLVLGIVAAALSLYLAVGGTLMLFTAQTETATNVVTLGAAKIVLQEKNNNDTDFINVPKDGVYSIGGSGKDGLAQPGDTLKKAPRITNDGSVDVYVYVATEISAWKDNVQVNISELYGKFLDTTSKEAGLLTALATAGFSANSLTGVVDVPYQWRGIDIKDMDWTADGKSLLGGFYYSESTSSVGSDEAKLYALKPGESTLPIFTAIKVPNFPVITVGDVEININNELAGVTLKLALTGYAVQAGNNPYAVLSGQGPKSYIKAFETDFPGITSTPTSGEHKIILPLSYGN